MSWPRPAAELNERQKLCAASPHAVSLAPMGMPAELIPPFVEKPSQRWCSRWAARPIPRAVAHIQHICSPARVEVHSRMNLSADKGSSGLWEPFRQSSTFCHIQTAVYVPTSALALTAPEWIVGAAPSPLTRANGRIAARMRHASSRS